MIGDPTTDAPRDGLIYDSGRTQVRRRLDDGRPVVVKQPLGPDAGTRLTRERAVLQRLADLGDAVPRLATSALLDDTLVMVDTGATALSARVPAEPMAPDDLVPLALALARILADVHRRGVVHRDVNPSNIVVGADATRPTLIDFDLASTLAFEQPEFTHQRDIVGTLAYLAPEQTGRLGRPVDHRADLYALGVTLYELVTGQLPFPDDDALQLIRDHVSRIPAPATAIRAEVPERLSAIIAHLLEKEPDRRYQSAGGLVHDLERLIADEPFVLGERDFPSRLAPPSRPLGREPEITALLDAFAGVHGPHPGGGGDTAGPGRGVMVSGPAGVGKSSVINELRPAVTAARGWFVTAKFDQFHPDGSDGALPVVLRALGRLLLTEPEAELVATRAQLAAALGPNAGLLADIPEMVALLGLPATRPDPEPAETGPRLLQAGCDVLRALASPSRPIALAVDDLQWAGPVSLAFVDAVLLDPGLRNVLVVGAYRDTELTEGHPLGALLARWRRLDAIRGIQLDNLGASDTAELLGSMLHLPPDDAAALAEVIGKHTGGNPYDTVELVNALRHDGALVLGSGGWGWDPATIGDRILDGDVVDRLRARIASLDDGARELVEILGCLGGRVERTVLAVAAGRRTAVVNERLDPALEEGILVTEGDDGPVGFRHDRVYQAAYGGLGPGLQGARHVTAARRFAAAGGYEPQAAGQYLAAVEAGGSEVLTTTERREVAGRFHRAAEAVRLVNPVLAERLLSAALRLLDDRRDGDDTLVIAVRGARHGIRCRLGRLDDADEDYDALTAGRVDRRELVDVVCGQIASLTSRRCASEAIALGLDLLDQLGVARPDDLQAAVGEGMAAWDRWVARLPDPAAATRISRRPELADPRLLAVAKVVECTSTAAFFGDPATHAWLCFLSQQLWVDHGPCAALLTGLGAADPVPLALRGDYRSAYKAHRHVLRLGEAYGYEPAASRTRNIFVACIQHWFEPLEGAFGQIEQAREGLIRGGELQFACFTHNLALLPLLDIAPTLDRVEAEAEAGLAFAARTSNDEAAAVLVVFRQLVRLLRGETRDGGLSDAEFDEVAHETRVAVMPLASAVFHTYRAWAAALFGDTADLGHHLQAALPLQPATPGLYSTAIVQLLHALALADELRTAGAAGAGPGDHDEPAARLDGCRNWLAARAADAPVNFGHLVTWVDAERSWAAGNLPAAAIRFDRAVRAAASRSRPWHRALVTERAGIFQIEQGLEHTGRMLLAEARRLYRDWGARAKVRQLDRAHPELARLPGEAVGTGGSLRTSAGVPSEAIDLLAVVSASQTLSSETNLDRLHERVVEVLGALTGATTVRMLLWGDETRGWTSAPSAPGTATDEQLPLSALRYVERTREPLLVEDATRDDRFAADPYVAGLECCSLLVVPILAHGVHRAMLVLENHFSHRVFTAERLGAVELIAGQLAVSLDNALAEHFRALVQRSADLTLVCRRDGPVTYASSASFSLLGIEDTALTGRPVLELVHADDRDALAARLQEATDATGGGTDVAVLECRALTADGLHRWVDVTFTNMLADPAVGGVMLHLRDVTERKAFQDQLSYQAAHDTLTGLPNRSVLAEALERLGADHGAGPFAVLFIDLDNFKPVNDSFGHGTGDEVLRTIAGRLQASVRAGRDRDRPDMVCRLGGDEFVVLLTEVTEDDARLAAERILTVVRQPIELAGSLITVGATIGGALSHPSLEHPDAAMRNADLAMYRAKLAGRNRYELARSRAGGDGEPALLVDDLRS